MVMVPLAAGGVVHVAWVSSSSSPSPLPAWPPPPPPQPDISKPATAVASSKLITEFDKRERGLFRTFRERINGSLLNYRRGSPEVSFKMRRRQRPELLIDIVNQLHEGGMSIPWQNRKAVLLGMADLAG